MYHHLFPPETAPYSPTSPLALLHSLLAFLRPIATTPTPLPLALNTFHTPSGPGPSASKPVVTTVVTSAALHAALLHDAEALRASHPGVERFKLAAHRNASVWWDGTLRLLGRPSIYSPLTSEWVPLSDGACTLPGPYSYFVSSLISRFETNFVVAPLRSPLHLLAPETPSLDLVLIRPLRHPATRRAWEAAGDDAAKQEAVRTGFVSQVWEVTGGMYDGGKHVDAVYEPDGADEGIAVVEYIRCEGFEWQPASIPPTLTSVLRAQWLTCRFVWAAQTATSDVKSSIVCLDGALQNVGPGGRVQTKALGAEFGIGVWA